MLPKRPKPPNKKTLDIQHTNKLSDFQKLQDHIHELKAEIKCIETSLGDFKEKQAQGYEPTEQEILDQIALQDKREQKQSELNAVVEKDEVDYFTNTAPLLFQYYDIVEKGNEASQPTLIGAGNNNILQFFKKTTASNETMMGSNESFSNAIDRASILDRYLWLTDENYVKGILSETKDKCLHCGSSNKSFLMNEGMIHCNSCDNVEFVLMDHDRPSYKDPPKEVTYFSYKRKNHLNEFESNRKFYRSLSIEVF